MDRGSRPEYTRHLNFVARQGGREKNLPISRSACSDEKKIPFSNVNRNPIPQSLASCFTDLSPLQISQQIHRDSLEGTSRDGTAPNFPLSAGQV